MTAGRRIGRRRSIALAEQEFKWAPLNPGYPGREVLYKLGITAVARLSDTLAGEWFAHLDYHRPDSNLRRDCSSYEAGRRGVELWAARHSDRLRAEVNAHHEAWLSRQTWRPNPRASGAAGETLAGHASGDDQQTTSIPDQSRVGSGTSRRRKSSRHRSPL